MLNNRGQAFSVFELMIAAIVAVAILFVLLPLLPNPDPVLGGPRDAIGNTLASVSSGGSFTSQEFTVTKDMPITSSQFSKEGFDSRSLIMAVQKNLYDQGGSSLFELTANSDISDPTSASIVVYRGNQSLALKAKVICEATGTLLKGTLDSIDGTFYSSVDDPTEHCGETEFSPCCIIILERK